MSPPGVDGGEGRQQIRFILFEGMDQELAGEIAEGVEEVYGTDVEIPDGTLKLPERGCDHQRGQYRARALINVLPHDDVGVKALGIASTDLYAPDLNFVFGQAQLPGDRAVMSIARLRPEFWGNDPDRDALIDRAIKEAVHELGHTLDIPHCDNPDCVMHFSNRLAETDRKGRDFCESCRPENIVQ